MGRDRCKKYIINRVSGRVIRSHGTVLGPRTSDCVSRKDNRDGEGSPLKTFWTSYPVQ